MQQDLLDILFLNRKQLSADSASSRSSESESKTAAAAWAATSSSPEYSRRAMAGGGGESIRGASAGSGETCPVDHKTREVWLSQARATSGEDAPPSQPSSPTTKSTPAAAVSHPRAASPSSWNPLTWRIPFFSASPSPPQPQSQSTNKRPDELDTSRVVSTIPRSYPSADGGASSARAPAAASACPVNHETETGADPATGNWIYPSEKMFFEAMKRKGTAGGARAADMRTVVPIHNAVNERAWKEIRQWEAPYTGDGKCDGPKLESFAGLATKLSPKARVNTWLGYTAPFDRHDWVVDRCGTRVEYVIDFYAGRPSAPGEPRLNFYLDVRPKLNSWEGVKMRAFRALGVV